MRSPPRSRPHSRVATPSASLSPATSTMPRMSFSLRTSPSRPVSPPWPAPDPGAMVFSGDVWLPHEPSFFSFGFGSKWIKTLLVLWLGRIVDGSSALPLLHMRLGDGAAVAVSGIRKPRGTKAKRGSANEATTQNPQDKRQIQLDVKSPEDLRRAVLYHTAALSSTLSFYVDTDAEHDHLVDLMYRTLASSSPSPPHSVRLPSPPTTPPPATPRTSVDSAFAKLEAARAKHQRGHIIDALAAYAAADQVLAAVDTQATVDVGGAHGGSALRTQIIHARQEIRSAVVALEMEKALPRAAVAVDTTTVDVSEPIPATQAPPTIPIDTRLLNLQTFAHTRDVDRAQREHRVADGDLALRFHALRNEKPTAPSLESLQQRLERLRGSPSTTTPMHGDTSARTASATATPQKLSPVDQIIQQAMDEITLGIVDDGEVEENASRSTSSSIESDSSASDSDSGSHTSRHRHQRHLL